MLAILLVIAAGVATFIMSLTTLDALVLTRDAYYRDYRFADIFTTVNRAPESLRTRIEAINGVDKVETRVVAPVKLTVKIILAQLSGKLSRSRIMVNPWLIACIFLKDVTSILSVMMKSF